MVPAALISLEKELYLGDSSGFIPKCPFHGAPVGELAWGLGLQQEIQGQVKTLRGLYTLQRL